MLPQQLHLIEELQKGLKKYAGRLNQETRLLMIHYAIEICIRNQKPRAALQWINPLLRIKKPKTRPDLVHFAWIYFFIAHYDLDNFEVIEVNLRSARNKWVKANAWGKFEHRMLTFFRQSVGAVHKRERLDLLAHLEKDLSEIFTDPEEAPKQHYFTLMEWIRNHQIE